MAIKNVTLTKRDLPIPIYQLVRGDRLTSGIMLNISRYDGSVDLSELGWAIKIQNSAEDTDVQIFNPTVTDKWLIYEWNFPAIVASEVGRTVFEVEGVNADNERVWQSGKRTIEVIENIEAEAGYEPESLTIFQQTINDVGVKVKAMEEAVDGYEERVSTAVALAEEATQRTVEATESASTATEDAINATEDTKNATELAVKATANAKYAAESASGAAETANNIAQYVIGKLEAGEFDGHTPVKGVDYFDGYTPVKGVDYFDGYTPVKDVDYFDGYTPVKNVDYFDGDDYILTENDKDEIALMAANDLSNRVENLIVTENNANEYTKLEIVDSDDDIELMTKEDFDFYTGKLKVDYETAVSKIENNVYRLENALTLVGQKTDAADIATAKVEEAIGKTDTAVAMAEETAATIKARADAGEFNGRDGYTPVKGVDYFDGENGDPGYTPIKGVDYFDGEKGDPGYTPVKGVDYNDGKDGYTPIKGIDYFDGEKGDPGYTPVKGIDYVDGKDWIPSESELEDIASNASTLLNDRIDNLIVTDGMVTNDTVMSITDTEEVELVTKQELDVVKESVDSATLEITQKADKSEIPDISDKADKADVGVVSDKLDALWKLSQGTVYDFRTVETDGNPIVPNGAKVGEVKNYGGKSVVWNQIVNSDTSIGGNASNGVQFTNNNDGSWTVKGTNNGESFSFVIVAIFKLLPDHKYFVKAIDGSSMETYSMSSSLGYKWINDTIYTTSTTYTVYLYPRVELNQTVEFTFYPQVIDLTQLFGSGNEPTSTSDPRIKWIKAYVEAHPEYNTGEIVSADVESVNYGNTAQPVPSAVRNLDGYGWSAGSVYNEVDFVNKKFIKRVGRVDLGTLEWHKGSTAYYYTTIKPLMKRTAGVTHVANMTTVFPKKAQTTYESEENSIAYFYTSSTDTESRILIHNTTVSDSSALKAFLNGQMLYYELSEPITTDITDLMTGFDPMFEVEAGGTIEFHNANNLPVPNSVEYLLKLSEVVS